MEKKFCSSSKRPDDVHETNCKRYLEDNDLNPKKKMSKPDDNFPESELFCIPTTAHAGSFAEVGLFYLDEISSKEKVTSNATLEIHDEENSVKLLAGEDKICQENTEEINLKSNPETLSDMQTGDDYESFLRDYEFHSYCETESLASLSQSAGSEDLSLTLASSVSKKQKKKKKKKKDLEILNEDDKLKVLRPNYFVGIQISNPEIHKTVVEVQNSLLNFDEKLFPALVDVATLHITLLVAHISTDDDLHIACSALDHCGARLCEELSDPPLMPSFFGVSHFAHQTLYAKMVENEHYRRLFSAANVIRSIFSERGIVAPDEKELKPHLTIAKLSKVPRGKGKNGIRKIEPSSYEGHLNKEFGEQVISGFQLLSMNKPKDANRYYYCSRESLFDVITNESLDHAFCCHPRQPPTPSIFRKDYHRKLHTDAKTYPNAAAVESTSASISNSTTSPVEASRRRFLQSLPLPSRSLTVKLISGAALLSFAFVISKMMKKR